MIAQISPRAANVPQAGPRPDRPRLPEGGPSRRMRSWRSNRAGDDDVVAAAYSGSSLPACSRTMYSAYQSGQPASCWPDRSSCSPCAAAARRSAVDEANSCRPCPPVRAINLPRSGRSRAYETWSCSGLPAQTASMAQAERTRVDRRHYRATGVWIGQTVSFSDRGSRPTSPINSRRRSSGAVERWFCHGDISGWHGFPFRRRFAAAGGPMGFAGCGWRVLRGASAAPSFR